MCHFITGTLPRAAARTVLAPILREHGLAFSALDNPFVQAQLAPGDAYSRATKAWCDCGTPLGSARRGRGAVAQDGAHVARMKEALRKKGWGSAKIERWLVQQARTRERDERVRKDHDAANAAYLETWRDALAALARTAGPVGLLLHWYHGGLETERIEIARREPVALRSLDVAALAGIEEDMLYVFAE
ncbi:MAG: hypothetical protein HY996_02265 [Micrococcales bacterium]|nr:hypothetical protein [Micrococcales bacterium]